MSFKTKLEQRRKTASRWEDSIPERADAIAKRICEEAKADFAPRQTLAMVDDMIVTGKTPEGLTLAKLKAAAALIDARPTFRRDGSTGAIIGNAAQYRDLAGCEPPEGTEFPLEITL